MDASSTHAFNLPQQRTVDPLVAVPPASSQKPQAACSRTTTDLITGKTRLTAASTVPRGGVQPLPYTVYLRNRVLKRNQRIRDQESGMSKCTNHGITSNSDSIRRASVQCRFLGGHFLRPREFHVGERTCVDVYPKTSLNRKQRQRRQLF